MQKTHIFEPALLEVLVAVADTASFTKAAAALRRSQSTISMAVQRLEKAAGCKLVERTTHAVMLTSDGEEMVRYARLIMSLAEQAQRRFSQPEVSGVIRFGLFTSFDSPLLPTAIAQFRRQHPSLQLALETQRSDILLERFRKGLLDLILMTKLPGHGLGPPLWQDDFVWVGRPGLVECDDEPVPLAVRMHPSMLRRAGEEALTASRRRYTVTFEGWTFPSIASALRAGVGVSIFTKSVRPLDLPLIDDGRLPVLGRVDFLLLQREPDETGAIKDLSRIIHDLCPEMLTSAASSMFGFYPESL